MASDRVRIYEVGPRDGLQNERTAVPTVDKIHLIDLLSAAGFDRIEATSFVSPRWVPQLADADAVMNGIARRTGTSYAALVPNLTGYGRACAARVDEMAVFASASEGFSRRNINCSIAESIERFRPVAEQALADRIPLRGYVSCVVRCPYDGDVSPGAVAGVAEQLLALGCYEISLGDTIGAGTPDSVRAMLRAVLAVAGPERFAGHFHDTGGMAIANIEAALTLGLRTFDAAVGGLGGCPFAPGARGNVATGTVVELMSELGLRTGIDRARLGAAESFVVALRKRLA